MNRKLVGSLVGLGVVVAGAAVATAATVSYVGSNGDPSRWGARLYRRFDVAERLATLHLVAEALVSRLPWVKSSSSVNEAHDMFMALLRQAQVGATKR